MPSSDSQVPGGGPDQGPKPLKDQAPANQWLALLNLGWVLVGTMGISVFGGVWLDKHFGTAPVFILIGVFLGFAASGYSFYSTLKKLDATSPNKPGVKP